MWEARRDKGSVKEPLSRQPCGGTDPEVRGGVGRAPRQRFGDGAVLSSSLLRHEPRGDGRCRTRSQRELRSGASVAA